MIVYEVHYNSYGDKLSSRHFTTMKLVDEYMQYMYDTYGWEKTLKNDRSEGFRRSGWVI